MIVALLLLVLFVLPALLSLYYVDASTQVAIYAIVALGLDCWPDESGWSRSGRPRCSRSAPGWQPGCCSPPRCRFRLVLLLAGLVTMALGTVVGLPALRLSGLHLALITLMLAGAITVVLASTNFPNGGHGFLGYNSDALHTPAIRRPAIASSDPAFFRYSVIVGTLMFLLALVHVRTRPGRAWAAIRQSEAAARAAGINTTLYKLGVRTGVVRHRGGRRPALRRSSRYLYSIDFPTQASITLLAVVLMGGIFSLWGAIVAALLLQLLPALLNSWGVAIRN